MESIPSKKYDYVKTKKNILELINFIDNIKNEEYSLLSEKLDYLIQASQDLGISFIYLLLALKNKKSQNNIGNLLITLYYSEIEKQKIEKLFYIIKEGFNFIGPKGYSISNPIEKEFLENIEIFDIMENNSEDKPRSEGTLIETIYFKIASIIDLYNTFMSIDENSEEDRKEIQEKYNECQKDINNLKENKSIQNLNFYIDFFNDLLNIIDFNKLYRKNSSSKQDSPMTISTINDLSLSNSLSQNLSQSFSQHLENIPLKDRKYFIINEILNQDEDIETEYKDYFFENNGLPNDLAYIIKKTICAMLNNKGGRIYFGINDHKVVKGMKLFYEQKDKIRLYLLNLTSFFYPEVKSSKISVHFIPIKDSNQNFLVNIYVIKMIVKQGDTKKLYSISNKVYESYMRVQGMNSTLPIQEIEKEIIERNSNPKKQIPDKEFEDPEPEVNYYENNKGNENYINFGYYHKKGKKHKKNKKNIVIKITNIDKKTPIDVFKNIFTEFNDKMEKEPDFLESKGFSLGSGYIYPKDKDSAIFLINTFNGMDIYGKNINLYIDKQ